MGNRALVHRGCRRGADGVETRNSDLETQNARGRPVAFLQVDLDGLWAVRRCYGVSGSPEQDDPVYSHALPALLDLFDRLAVKATFFVVGADAEVAWKRRHLEVALERGHELANHSMTHTLPSHETSNPERETRNAESELATCQRTLGETLGIEARGHRTPGYAFSPALLETLERLGFWYDASQLPTPWGWFMRWVGRRISARPQPGTRNAKRETQYGSVRDWHAPLRPYRPQFSGHNTQPGVSNSVWEIPISVWPTWRLPFHGSMGYRLGRRWVNGALRSLQQGEGFLNYVVHGMDLVDGRMWNVTPTRMGQWLFSGGARERLDFFVETFRQITQGFEVRRTDHWVEQARKSVENR